MKTYERIVLGGLMALGLLACSSMDSSSSGMSGSSGSVASGSGMNSHMHDPIPSGSNPSSDNGADDGEGAGGSPNAMIIGEPVGWGGSPNANRVTADNGTR